MAKELCEDGAVQLNGKTVPAAKEIAPGDRLSLRLWSRRLELEVEALPERALSAVEARKAYRILSEERIEETW